MKMLNDEQEKALLSLHDVLVDMLDEDENVFGDEDLPIVQEAVEVLKNL